MSAGTALRRSREDWVEIISDPLFEGWSAKRVAQELGISRSFVSEIRRDPTGNQARERKQRYKGTCLSCGADTTGSEGPRLAPKLCAACSIKKRHEERYWTRERIIVAIQAYVAKHGHPPNSQECLTGNRDVAPPVTQVQREFGSWRAGVLAAGFDIPAVGHYVRTEQYRRDLAVRSSKAGIEWTKDAVIIAIRNWYLLHGRIPLSDEWMFASKSTPSMNTVRKRFGTWNAGIRAAGYEPRRQGSRNLPITHGTTSGYSRGCRCAECKQAHNTHAREWRADRKAACAVKLLQTRATASRVAAL